MEKSVADWYSGQKILITGATGFMGKILVEKLLWSCPKVTAIYVLIRPKKGKSPQDRLGAFFKEPVFDRLRACSNKNIFDKVQCINGDITEKNCGISETEKATLEETVTMVFHMAADVRFNLTLKAAVLFNVKGTLNLLELARNFKQLKAFVHVSTLYCHCEENMLEERVYNAPDDPRQILNLVSLLDDNALHFLTPRLLKTLPNTYAYTKCLAEALVSEYSEILPIIIARPSTVTAAWKEPMPGWVDNLQGTTGIMVAAGKGLLRSVACKQHLKANIVPVDVSVNSLLIVGCKGEPVNETNTGGVYHIMTRKELCKSWKDTFMLLRKFYFMYPFSVVLWFPSLTLYSTYTHHLLSAFFLQFIPAYLLDFLMVLARRKPIFVNIQKRINGGIKVFVYYAMKSWNFENRKVFQLYDSLSKNDMETFYINKREFDYDEYMRNYLLGTRKYCLKEDMDTVPKAKKLLKWLKYLQFVTTSIFYGLVIWIIIMFT